MRQIGQQNQILYEPTKPLLLTPGLRVYVPNPISPSKYIWHVVMQLPDSVNMA